MNDDKMVDAVGQLREGQTLVYLLYHRIHSLYAGTINSPTGVQYATSCKDAHRWEFRTVADGFRNLLAFPQQWKVVPAVYDAVDDTVTPVGG